MNIFDIIIEQLSTHVGWRFYLPLLVVAAGATVVHFTIGWSEATTSIFVILTLAAALAGIFWQQVHDRDQG